MLCSGNRSLECMKTGFRAGIFDLGFLLRSMSLAVYSSALNSTTGVLIVGTAAGFRSLLLMFLKEVNAK